MFDLAWHRDRITEITSKLPLSFSQDLQPSLAPGIALQHIPVYDLLQNLSSGFIQFSLLLADAVSKSSLAFTGKNIASSRCACLASSMAVPEQAHRAFGRKHESAAFWVADW